MMVEYEYMADKRCNPPFVVRVGEDHVFRGYNPALPEKWFESKFLDALAWGGGDFSWYDDISEDEAKDYMALADKAFADR